MDDERAILDAVLDALSLEGYLRSATGTLAAHRELARSLDALVHPLPATWTIEVEKLALVSATTDAAVVELAALRRGVALDPFGRESDVPFRYSGPVEVVREGGVWKVADLVGHGTRYSESFFVPQISGSVEGVGVVGLGLVLYRNSGLLQLFLETQSDLPQPVPIRGVTVGTRTKLGRWRWGHAQLPFGMRDVPQGSYRFSLAAQSASIELGENVRVLIATDVGLLDVRSPAARVQKKWPRRVQAPWVWPSADAEDSTRTMRIGGLLRRQRLLIALIVFIVLLVGLRASFGTTNHFGGASGIAFVGASGVGAHSNARGQYVEARVSKCLAAHKIIVALANDPRVFYPGQTGQLILLTASGAYLYFWKSPALARKNAANLLQNLGMYPGAIEPGKADLVIGNVVALWNSATAASEQLVSRCVVGSRA